MQGITYEDIQKAIQDHLKGRTQGYFFTLDSPYTTLNTTFSAEFFDRYADRRVIPFVKAMNRFCYGRSFSPEGKKLLTVEALEIGKETLRLHSHLIMLHDGDCVRSIEEIDDRARLIWKRLVNRCGKSFVEVSAFDPDRHWLNYMTKSYTFTQSKFEYENVRFH